MLPPPSVTRCYTRFRCLALQKVLTHARSISGRSSSRQSLQGDSDGLYQVIQPVVRRVVNPRRLRISSIISL